MAVVPFCACAACRAPDACALPVCQCLPPGRAAPGKWVLRLFSLRTSAPVGERICAVSRRDVATALCQREAEGEGGRCDGTGRAGPGQTEPIQGDPRDDEAEAGAEGSSGVAAVRRPLTGAMELDGAGLQPFLRVWGQVSLFSPAGKGTCVNASNSS